jgi:hypothetical protein
MYRSRMVDLHPELELEYLRERALRSAALLRQQAEQLAADLARFRAIHPPTKGEQL